MHKCFKKSLKLQYVQKYILLWFQDMFEKKRDHICVLIHDGMVCACVCKWKKKSVSLEAKGSIYILKTVTS